jgi:D-sedoheptulose 7-phosphate isomerase
MATDPPGRVIRTRISESMAVKEGLLAEETVAIVARAAAAIANAFREKRKVLLFGNGGSAADAQHLAAEFVGRFQHSRPALPALALVGNSSAMTSIANDYDFTEVFARQIEALGNPGDVAVAISTSGQSPNVLKGLEVSRAQDLVTVGLTGADGGAMSALVDHCLRAPSTDVARIQEAHILLEHIICELVERELFAP